MNFFPTNHPDIIRVQPKVFTDSRGFFMESYQKETFYKAGIRYDFVQDNHSSSKQSTLRGLHYQVTHTQGKLVRVIMGEIFDVAVDLRKKSPHFGKWVGAYLSDKNKEQLWIPPGFAHGFYTLSERTEVLYKTTDYYDAKGDRCIHWNDPTLGIEWPIPEGVEPLVSKKDSMGVSFLEAEVFYES
jgi:dTDP-4-dehydrorhamnose 3,5-epimerase